VNRLWRRRRSPLTLEAELRANRPEPSSDFLVNLSERVREQDRRRPSSLRIAFAGALTAGMLVAVASVGGFGYAATAARQAVESVHAILVGSEPSGPVEVRGLSAGGDQYLAGFSWGDPDHNHGGPPGLARGGGELAPPLQALCRAGTARLTTRIVLDEQAVLRLSVLGPEGERLLLTQRGSRVGGEVSGPQTKTIRYRVLVPRVLRISLRIPCNLLADGETYRLRIGATDPSGNTSTLVLPFRALTGIA
jgi:hypothetical protein